MEINKARFYQIVYDHTFSAHERFNIGTYKEKKLHLILKDYFETDSACHEIPVNGYIADICRGKTITEIQTGGFSGLGPKLSAYLPDYTVRLVYPLAVHKTVSWIDPETSEILPRHNSPLHATVYDAIFELCRLLPYVNDPHLTVLAVLLDIDEYRLLDGWSRDRKRGSHRYERVPSELHGITELTTAEDFAAWIPENCPTSFTTADFAKGAKIDGRTAGGVVKVFETKGIIRKAGKRGRANLFERV